MRNNQDAKTTDNIDDATKTTNIIIEQIDPKSIEKLINPILNTLKTTRDAYSEAAYDCFLRNTSGISSFTTTLTTCIVEAESLARDINHNRHYDHNFFKHDLLLSRFRKNIEFFYQAFTKIENVSRPYRDNRFDYESFGEIFPKLTESLTKDYKIFITHYDELAYKAALTNIIFDTEKHFEDAKNNDGEKTLKFASLLRGDIDTHNDIFSKIERMDFSVLTDEFTSGLAAIKEKESALKEKESTIKQEEERKFNETVTKIKNLKTHLENKRSEYRSEKNGMTFFERTKKLLELKISGCNEALKLLTPPYDNVSAIKEINKCIIDMKELDDRSHLAYSLSDAISFAAEMAASQESTLSQNRHGLYSAPNPLKEISVYATFTPTGSDESHTL